MTLAQTIVDSFAKLEDVGDPPDILVLARETLRLEAQARDIDRALVAELRRVEQAFKGVFVDMSELCRRAADEIERGVRS